MALRFTGLLLLILGCTAHERPSRELVTPAEPRDSAPWWKTSTNFQPAEAAVHGEVHAQDLLAAPLAGVRVQGLLYDEVVAEAVTDEAGRYRLELEDALARLDLKLPWKKTERYWHLRIVLSREGYEPSEVGATVPHDVRPLPTAFMKPREDVGEAAGRKKTK